MPPANELFSCKSMAGVAGRSGGHNRLSIADHQRRGTFRRGRHALAAVDLMPPSTEEHRPPKPPRGLLTGLGAAGRRFVRSAYANYELDDFEAELLRLAALNLDDAANAREAGDLKAAARAVRQVTQILLRLGMPMLRSQQ